RHLAFGAVLACAFLLHRSALGFVPAAAWAWIKGRDRRRFWGAALPAVALALLAPRLLQSLHSFDTTHFTAPGDSIPAAAARLDARLSGRPLVRRRALRSRRGRARARRAARA